MGAHHLEGPQIAKAKYSTQNCGTGEGAHMRKRLAVAASQLRRTWDPARLGFATTAELPELKGLVGQEEAVRALESGLSLRSPGYNVYVAGPAGTGKTSYTSSLVRARAAGEPSAQDWVYVHNFDRPDEPLAIALPAGTGASLVRAMDEVIADAQRIAARAIAGPEHQGRRDELLRAAQQQTEQAMLELEQLASAHDFGLTHTDHGIVPVPLRDGQPMTGEQFESLSSAERREITARAQEIQRAVAEAGRRAWEVEKAVRAELRRLDREVTGGALGPMIDALKARFPGVPALASWLDRMALELIDPAIPSRGAEEVARPTDPFARFRVNLLVANDPAGGAPVVIEPNPTYVNLFGKAEYVAEDDGPGNRHLQIKAGAVHRANGGYLILQAADLLASATAWDALKRALAMQEVRIEAPGAENRVLPVALLRPEPVPLNLKVILIGSAQLYHALYAVDEAFRKQFKFRAEFETGMEANEQNVAGYASFIASVCRRERLRDMTAAGVAQVLSHSHRLSEDQTKLSARFNEVVEVIYEADAWAALAGSPVVDSPHVRQAVRAKADCSSLPERHLLEQIRRGTLLIDVSGQVVGQVNGLTVMQRGDYRFGSPRRITARVFMGQKGVLHIEREVAMSGQIHDKGLLTLIGYLGDRFGQDKPLTFSASIAFEQSYLPIDGDSASVAELIALLSALADVPVKQSIAVTGSVNQRGEIQPIGGVNEKVEGFFRVCAELGLTGRQGVVIPRQNLHNLMLDDDVVAAVEQGRFHVWATDTIEEAIEILTGLSAGERDAGGRFAPGSLFDRVDSRIRQLARQYAAWRNGAHEDDTV